MSFGYSGAPAAFAAMRSPIPIEPMHSFSHGHHDQRHMARGRVRTYDDENVAQYGAHTGQPRLCMQLTILQFDSQDPFHG